MRLRLVLVGLVAVATGASALPPPRGAGTLPLDALDRQIDAQIYDGFERPARALQALRRMQTEHVGEPQAQRHLMVAVGIVAARAGDALHAAASAEQLLALTPEEGGADAVAASNLVRAEAAVTAGQVDIGAALAAPSVATFLPGCGLDAAATPTPAASVPAGANCDWRSAWRGLRVLIRRSETLGVNAAATTHAEAALRLVEWSGDAWRQTVAYTMLGRLAEGRGDHELALSHLAQARRLAVQPPNPAQQAQIDSVEATVLSARGELTQAMLMRERACALAAQAGAPRLQAAMLANLSDAYARLRRPADALRTAEQALVIVRAHNDLRAERVLIANAGIAKIGLGRVADGKQDLARVLELWQRSGETGRQVETLLDFGEAFANAGDARDALDLYHRERAISDELMKTNRRIALKELQTRNDAQARERDIELLARENALNTAALSNRDLLQSIWALLSAVMLLACALVALLYRRVRQTHGHLAASHARLQLQSERDPLTHLANRRHFQSVMAGLVERGGGFDGALLLVDADHFKQVNDRHGHARGDQALIEIAQRLISAVRAGDLVVRWGGEEFLVLAPGATGEQAQQMAQRMLGSVSQTPVVVDGAALRMTVSIGYASFPLPSHGLRTGWEESVDLIDKALMIAKRRGRNLALGIVASTAVDVDALRRARADVDQAVADATLTLRETRGPSVAAGLRAA